MMIVSDEDFSANLLSDYTDEPYFKLLHDLRKIDNVDLPEGFVMTQGNTEEFAAHINTAYETEGVTTEELEQYKTALSMMPIYGFASAIHRTWTLSPAVSRNWISRLEKATLSGFKCRTITGTWGSGNVSSMSFYLDSRTRLIS